MNGWFGGYDKLSTTRRMFREDFDIDIDRDRDSFVFVGDSAYGTHEVARFVHRHRDFWPDAETRQ